MNKKIAVAGTGYVGLSIATLLAQHNTVTAVDIIPEKVDKINHRISPIQDEYIEKYLAEKELRLTATLDARKAYADADFVVIAAPTNYDPKTNYFDTHNIEDVIDLVLEVNPTATMVIGFGETMAQRIEHMEKIRDKVPKAIVEDWAEQNDHETFQSEVFVQDDTHQLCGVIDLIQGATILDFKTGDIHQKISHNLGSAFPNDRLSLYTLQLNFYRYIMEQNGSKIKALFVWWLNGEHWEKVKVDIIDIRPYLEEVWKPTK